MLWINKMVLGNTVLRWVIAGALVTGLAALARLIQRRLAPRLAARAARTGGLLDLCLADLLARTHLLFILAFTLTAGAQLLELPARPARFLGLLPPLALILQAAAWGHWAIGLWVDRKWLVGVGAQPKAQRPALINRLSRLPHPPDNHARKHDRHDCQRDANPFAHVSGDS